MVDPNELLPPLKQALDNPGLDPISQFIASGIPISNHPSVAVQSLDILIQLFWDKSVDALYKQQVILCLASAYPHILKFS